MPSVPVRRDIGSPSAAEVVEVERGSPHSESSLATTLPSVLVRRASCEVPGPMNVGNMDSISSLATTLPSVLVRKGSSSAVARLGAQFNGGAAKTSDEAVGLATAMPSVLASRASDEASVSQAGARVAGNDVGFECVIIAEFVATKHAAAKCIAWLSYFKLLLLPAAWA